MMRKEEEEERPGRNTSGRQDGYSNGKASTEKKKKKKKGFQGKHVFTYHGGIRPSKMLPWLIWKHLSMFILVLLLIVFFLVLDSLILTLIHQFSSCHGLAQNEINLLEGRNQIYLLCQLLLKDVRTEKTNKATKTEKVMHERLLSLASNADRKSEVEDSSMGLFEEPNKMASKWKPCADKRTPVSQGHAKNRTGFILVSANGGLNQQRVAVCNAVAVAALLNATLVLPKFLYSSVWKDTSQFGDIYQEDYFINYMKDDVEMVKELPPHLQSVDIEAIGSLITDTDIMKEAEPKYFTEFVLPILLKNGLVHFLGFGNRLGFDPSPLYLQSLRCKCNFHALKFVPRIRKIGSLLVKRIRKYDKTLTETDKHLLGKYMLDHPVVEGSNISGGPIPYLALHMRFEIDMVAYSLCDFGCGEKEREELQSYREIHFPLLVMQMQKNKTVSAEEARSLGRCPLTPEEAGLMLSALGYKRETYIYLAGSSIYGGESRMLPFKRLYPNMITKEDVLTSEELAPFRNYSSQLAALDFIACATADVFTMTDSGSQLSSLVTGYRVYHGGGRAPTLRPNRKRWAKMLSQSEAIIDWGSFQQKVRGMIAQGQRVVARRKGRSLYRLPRTPGCMLETPPDD